MATSKNNSLLKCQIRCRLYLKQEKCIRLSNDLKFRNAVAKPAWDGIPQTSYMNLEFAMTQHSSKLRYWIGHSDSRKDLYIWLLIQTIRRKIKQEVKFNWRWFQFGYIMHIYQCKWMTLVDVFRMSNCLYIIMINPL